MSPVGCQGIAIQPRQAHNSRPDRTPMGSTCNQEASRSSFTPSRASQNFCRAAIVSVGSPSCFMRRRWVCIAYDSALVAMSASIENTPPLYRRCSTFGSRRLLHEISSPTLASETSGLGWAFDHSICVGLESCQGPGILSLGKNKLLFAWLL